MFGGRYLIGCVLLFACGALGFPRAPIDMEPPLALQALDAPPPDQETFGYLIPRLATKYRPSLAWGGVSDPRLYVLTELDDVQDVEDPMRAKRRQPSLSIVNPMDVLRQRLLLEIARKKMKDNAERNREFLKNVGKRVSMPSERSLADLYNVDQKSEDKKVADYLANQRTAL